MRFLIREKLKSAGGGPLIYRKLTEFYLAEHGRFVDDGKVLSFGNIALDLESYVDHTWYCLGLCDPWWELKWNRYLFWGSSIFSRRRIASWSRALARRPKTRRMLRESNVISPCIYTSRKLKSFGAPRVYVS